MAEAEAKTRALRKQRKGKVVTRSGDKTIVVLVERRVQHPLYKKVIRRFKRYHVHDERNEANVGDLVQIRETRPLSKLKRWRLEAVLQPARG